MTDYHTETVSDEGWRKVLDHWRKTGKWRDVNGPRPGEAGCRVPAHLMNGGGPTSTSDVHGIVPDLPPDMATVQTLWTPSISPDGPPPDEPLAPLPWLDMAAWDTAPIPERKWAIRDRVPLDQTCLFSGEGGTGKSIIELMKDIAHVTGKDWLFSMPEQGPAFYLAAEDHQDELHIRLAAIAKHYGVTFKELVEGGLHILPLLGKDATLCAVVGKSGGRHQTEEHLNRHTVPRLRR
jgi:hypothetical protein